MAQQSLMGQAPIIFENSQPHSDTSRDKTQHLQRTDIHAPDRIRTRNPSKWAAANLRLWRRRHRDLPSFNKYTVKIRNRLCSSASNIRWSYQIRWDTQVMCDVLRRGEMHTWFLVGKTERKSSLGRSRLRWEDTIKVDRQEIGCGRGAWTEFILLGTEKISELLWTRQRDIRCFITWGEFE